MKVDNYYKIFPYYSLSRSYVLVGKLVSIAPDYFYFKMFKTGKTIPYTKDGTTFIELTDLEVALL